MNRDRLIDFADYKYAFNTCEAYTIDAYLINNILLIPYINAQISDDNPFQISIGEKINFSYLLLSGVSRITWNGSKQNGDRIIGELTLNNIESNVCTDYFGINRLKDGYEIKVNFKTIEVFVHSQSKCSKNEWTPWTTPNFPKNLNDHEIEDFFSLSKLPNEIKERYNREKPVAIEFNKSDSVVIDQIRQKW